MRSFPPVTCKSSLYSGRSHRQGNPNAAKAALKASRCTSSVSASVPSTSNIRASKAIRSSNKSAACFGTTDYPNAVASEERNTAGFHPSANDRAPGNALWRIESIKCFLGFIAQRGTGRGLLREHAAGQQIGSLDGHQIVSRDFDLARGAHDAIGLAQSRPIQRITNRARVREMRQQLPRGDVTL